MNRKNPYGMQLFGLSKKLKSASHQSPQCLRWLTLSETQLSWIFIETRRRPLNTSLIQSRLKSDKTIYVRALLDLI